MLFSRTRVFRNTCQISNEDVKTNTRQKFISIYCKAPKKCTQSLKSRIACLVWTNCLRNKIAKWKNKFSLQRHVFEFKNNRIAARTCVCAKKCFISHNRSYMYTLLISEIAREAKPRMDTRCVFAESMSAINASTASWISRSLLNREVNFHSSRVRKTYVCNYLGAPERSLTSIRLISGNYLKVISLSLRDRRQENNFATR